MKSREIMPLNSRYLGELTNVSDKEIDKWLKDYNEALTICESELELERLINQQLQRENKELRDKTNIFRFYTIKETCSMLQISSRTLQTLRDNGEIAFTQRGNKIFFLEEHINEFLGR